MELPTEIPSVILSVNPLVIKKYYYRGIYRQNEADKFFFFNTNGFIDGKKITDKRFTDRAFPLVIPSVINLPTEYVSYLDGKIPSVKLLNLVVICFLLVGEPSSSLPLVLPFDKFSLSLERIEYMF